MCCCTLYEIKVVYYCTNKTEVK